MAVAELVQARKLIPRWDGHGDLLIVVVDSDEVFLRADDVERMAALTPWGRGETILGDAWPLEVDGVAFYTVTDAVARARDEGTSQAGEFLTWLDDTLRSLLDEEVLAQANPLQNYSAAFSMHHAAEILDREVDTHIGRKILFDHMHAQGWLHRAGNDWAPTVHALANDWLTLRDVRVPHGKTRTRPYRQVYVTAAGLAELRRTIPELNHSPSDPHPRLFD